MGIKWVFLFLDQATKLSLISMQIYLYFYKNMNYVYQLNALSLRALRYINKTGVTFVCALYELFLNEKFRGVKTGRAGWAFLHPECPPNI